MICPNCKTFNENENVFCVNCGVTITQSENPGEISTQPAVQFPASDSLETEVLPVSQPNYPVPNTQPAFPVSANYAVPRKKRPWALLIGLPFLLILLAIGGGAYYLLVWQDRSRETLPDHFGLFSQSTDKAKLQELKKLDVTNAIESGKELLEDDDLPELTNDPTVILYADSNDIPLNDLKLIELDSIKDDGSFLRLDFQAGPVDGKPQMKKLRVEKELATGKYAFALFEGDFDEGKHRFWPFQIDKGTKSDNGDMAKSALISLKPKESKPASGPAPAAAPAVPPPTGSSVATVTQGNVIMRAGASQSTAKIGKFSRGQRVYVIEYSSNYESFKSYYSNYARVQTADGKTGWIYAAFLR